MSRNNLKVCPPSRILSLWNAWLTEQLATSSTRVHSLWDWDFFLQLQHSNPLLSQQCLCCRKQQKTCCKFYKLYVIFLLMGHSLEKSHLVCCRRACVVLSARLSILIWSVITCSMPLCFFNKPQGCTHKVKQIHNWGSHCFALVYVPVQPGLGENGIAWPYAQACLYFVLVS